MVTGVGMEEPRRPAAAYYMIEAVLPVEYFLAPPPTKGMRVVVRGDDGAMVQFDMSAQQAGALQAALAAGGPPHVVLMQPFGG